MAKKYYWPKLMGDFFTQPKIKKLIVKNMLEENECLIIKNIII